ncbi:HAD family hydrolase [Paenibacillus alba]|uniref:HAD family hydrolase n=1 Tax=Paenibacillus alba TaxID=1197127 RepID=UPI001566AE81|nr:HAD family hydrolase [Paenibacillus alba]NQX67487.1 HAD family hydrolase [Paenibacillus alba]
MHRILLVSDMDGTLLDREQRISAENAEAIRRFQAQGGLFTLATGRTEAAVAPYVRELGIRVPLILYNGARLYCPAEDKVLEEKYLELDPSLWGEIVDLAGADAAVLVYHCGSVFSANRNSWLDAHERKDGVASQSISELAEWPCPITKVLIVAATPQKALQLEELVHSSGLPCELVYSEETYLEILPFKASKGEALQELIRHLGVEGLRTIGIGNHLNDISLIQQADLGYAVDNAHPKLKEVADAHTVHYEEHALADIIHRLFDSN